MWIRTRMVFTIARAYLKIVGFVPYGLYLLWRQRRRPSQAVEDAAYYITQQWSRKLFSSLHVRVEVLGTENIPHSGPLVLISNHQSMWDIPLLMGYLGRSVGFVAKKELFRIPAFALWMRLIHSVPLDRGNPRSGSAMIEKLGRELKELGFCVAIFPEGTRTRDSGGLIGKFRQGSLRVATMNEIPILPVSFDGTRFLSDWEKMASTSNGGRVLRMKIAPPIVQSHRSAPEARQFAEELREIIVANRESIRVQWPDMGPQAAENTAPTGS